MKKAMTSLEKLKAYIELKYDGVTDFSCKLNCSRSHFSRILNGKIKPSFSMALDIEDLTGGFIKADELASRRLRRHKAG